MQLLNLKLKVIIDRKYVAVLFNPEHEYALEITDYGKLAGTKYQLVTMYKKVNKIILCHCAIDWSLQNEMYFFQKGCIQLNLSKESLTKYDHFLMLCRQSTLFT